MHQRGEIQEKNRQYGRDEGEEHCEIPFADAPNRLHHLKEDKNWRKNRYTPMATSQNEKALPN